MLNLGFKIFKDFNDWFYIQEQNSNSSSLGLGNILNPQGSDNQIKEFDYLNINKSLIKRIFLLESNTIVIFNNNDFFISGNFFNSNIGEFEKINELSGKEIKNIFQIRNEIIILEEEKQSIKFSVIDQNKNLYVPDWFLISPFQFENHKIKKIKENSKAIFVLMNNGEFYVYNKVDKCFNAKEINRWNVVKIPNTKINKIIDFDTNNESCVIICKDVFGSFYIYAAGNNEFGQLGLDEKTLYENFSKSNFEGENPKKIYLLNSNAYLVDESGYVYSTGKKDLLFDVEVDDINHFKKYYKNLLISEIHLNQNSGILESNQKTYYFFGLNSGNKLDEKSIGQIINEPEYMPGLSDANIETFVNYKADIINITNEENDSTPITTHSTTKIKIKYKKINKNFYSISYLDTSEIKEKPLLILTYSNKGENKFSYVDEQTVFDINKSYDFKVISLVNEKYKNAIGIINFPKIKECIELTKNNYSNIKINSEYKDIITIPIEENILITDKFKNKPLFFKFEVFDYEENKLFSLIDENEKEINNYIIEKENNKYFVYFEMMNDTKYEYCFYNQNDEVKYYKKINNIVKSYFFRNEKDNENIYFKKAFVKNKVFIAKYMEYFGYDVVYKIPVPTDLITYKNKMKITNDSENFNNFFIVDNEFYIYGNNINELLKDNIIYFKIENANIKIYWIKNESGVYKNQIKEQNKNEWKTFINQHINKITKDYFKNDDDIENFYLFKQYCIEQNIDNNFENYKEFCFKNINSDMVKTSINISENWVKEKTPVWINNSPTNINMWENETLKIENTREIETTLLKNTIIDSDIKKIQSDFILKNEINIEQVFASFELSKKYFKNNNTFEENENGNIIMNPLKNELLIYEPFSKYEKINRREKIEVVQIANPIGTEGIRKFGEERRKYLNENFKSVSNPIVVEGSIFAGISIITGDVII